MVGGVLVAWSIWSAFDDVVSVVVVSGGSRLGVSGAGPFALGCVCGIADAAAAVVAAAAAVAGVAAAAAAAIVVTAVAAAVIATAVAAIVAAAAVAAIAVVAAAVTAARLI